LGLPLAAAIWLYHPAATKAHPFPSEPAWRWPAIVLCLGAALVGLVLLTAPTVRGLVLRVRHGGATAPSPTPLAGYRTPNTPIPPGTPRLAETGWSMGVLTDGVMRTEFHKPMPPQGVTGDLPITVDMAGPAGQRGKEGRWDIWTWTAHDVVIVNESDDPITLRVWLVIEVKDGVPIRELQRIPNEPISVGPRLTTTATVQFVLNLSLLTGVARLTVDPPKEMVFLELGSKQRELRVSFSKRTRSGPAA
jgi:hypothetical protein